MLWKTTGGIPKTNALFSFSHHSYSSLLHFLLREPRKRICLTQCSCILLPTSECCQVLISENFEFYQDFLFFFGLTAFLGQNAVKAAKKIFDFKVFLSNE